MRSRAFGVLVALIMLTALLSSDASAYTSGLEDSQFLSVQKVRTFNCCCGPITEPYPPIVYR